MNLTLYLNPDPVVITECGSADAYPLIVAFGSLRLAARAGDSSGIGVGEAGSVSVHLQNDKRQATRLIGRPLRARAELKEDGGAVIFAGIISNISIDREMGLEIQP